jgi:hypothetical protein
LIDYHASRTKHATSQVYEADCETGSFVLREVIWANFFGRTSLGTVRGLSLFFSHLFAASGAPFFGFLHDRMGSYNLSFIIFSGALFTSGFLILLAKPPKKPNT